MAAVLMQFDVLPSALTTVNKERTVNNNCVETNAFAKKIQKLII